MNKSITILLLFLFIKTYSQETSNNMFDPSISLVFESNGITSYHFTDKIFPFLPAFPFVPRLTPSRFLL